MKRSPRLFREHRIFDHRGTEAAVYVCFERLADGKFCVQQLEFFREGSYEELASRLNEITLNTFELFAETAPSERCDWYDGIEAAIEAHRKEFENR